jgi:hypothetical protein
MVKRKHDIAQNFVWWNGSSCQFVSTIVFSPHTALAAHCEQQG